MDKLLKKIGAGFAAALVTFSPLALPTAGAEPAGNIVVLGDSYIANPDMTWNMLQTSAMSQLIPKDVPYRQGCVGSPDNFATHLANETGRPVDDWSCAGQTSRTLERRVEDAIAAGDIRPDTHAVTFGVGANDFGFIGALDRLSRGQFDAEAMGREMNENIVRAVDRIRAIAPEARIQLIGLPSVVDEGGNLCAINIIPNDPGLLPNGLPIGSGMEDAIELLQRSAAEAARIDFIDMRSVSRQNSTCGTPDELRQVAGVIDTTSPSWRFMVHPTIVGSQVMALSLIHI